VALLSQCCRYGITTIEHDCTRLLLLLMHLGRAVALQRLSHVTILIVLVASNYGALSVHLALEFRGDH